MYAEFKGSDDGHFFSWEIKNGKVSFFDAQSGLIDATEHFVGADPHSIISIRWDNLEPTEEVLKSSRKKVK